MKHLTESVVKIIFLRQPHKFIKKADNDLKEQIKEEVLRILDNPSIGKRLVGKSFKGIFSHKFVYVKVSYRVAYKVEGDLIIISIASRENFYRDLQI